MKKTLMSILTISTIAMVAYAGTTAFFSDEETSTGNTFQAGAIDLLIDSTAHYNGMVCIDGKWEPENPQLTPAPGQYPVAGTDCNGSWTSTDMNTISNRAFFSYEDLKPGDNGENTISLTVNTNDAYMCAIIDNMQDDDLGLTEPEEEDGDTTDGLGNGELASELRFFAWADDSDNIWEPGELPLFSNTEGPASDILDGKVYPMFTPDVNGGAVFPANTTKYIGLFWCYGDIDTTGNVLTCNGSDVSNVSQTDKLTADISFYVEQARNNSDFTCPVLETEPENKIGANIGGYQAPVCTITLNPDASIQEAIDSASENSVICLNDGFYTSDDYPLIINKDNLTLAGVNPPTATAELDGGVMIGNDGGKVTGLKINSSTALSETFAIYINSGVDGANITYNVLVGPNSGTTRGVINSTGTTTNAYIANNVVSGWTVGIFMNPSSGMQMEYNTLTGNVVGSANDGPSGNSIKYSIIKNNTAEGIGVSDSTVDTSGSLVVNFNNIYGNPAGNQMNNYDLGTTDGGFEVDAENNWWGDNTPADNINSAGGPYGSIDFDPFELAAFAEN